MSTPGPPKPPSAALSPRSTPPTAAPAAAATPPPPKTPSLPSSLSTPQGMTAAAARRVSTGFTTSPSATSLTGRGSMGGDLSAGRLSTFRSLRTMKTSPVVLDMGESVTRAGFASEPAPRHIIPTAWEYPDGTKAHGVLSRGLNNIKQKAWSRILNKFLTAIFYDYLQVNPKDRRVVLVENPFWPMAFKKAAVSVLFSLEVPGVLLLPSTHLPLFSVGGTHALHIDCGYGETRVQPIYEGYSAGDALTICPVGMRDVGSVFAELTQKEGKVVDHDGKAGSSPVPWSVFSAQAWESLAARTAFVRAMPAAKLQQLQDQRQKFDEAELKRVSAPTHVRRVSTSGPLLGSEAAIDALAKHAMPEDPAIPPIGNNPPPPSQVSASVLSAAQSASRRSSLNKTGAPPPPPTKETPLPAAVSLHLSASRQITVPPSARHSAGDVLFGENEEAFNIAHSALSSLLKLDGEVRVLVAQNILLSGGTANLPGFARRLLDELNGALFLPKYSELRALHHRFRLFAVPQGLPSGNMAWVGASIVGSLEIDASRFLVRDRVEQKKQRVPDWSLNPLQSLFTELEEKTEDPQPSSSPVPTDPEDTTTY